MRRVDMCAVLYCSPEQLSATFVAGRNDHRSDIACATRLREGVCRKAPEHTVNITRGKRTGFGIDRPEGRTSRRCFKRLASPPNRPAPEGYLPTPAGPSRNNAWA